MLRGGLVTGYFPEDGIGEIDPRVRPASETSPTGYFAERRAEEVACA
jgi:hypothetical protein